MAILAALISIVACACQSQLCLTLYNPKDCSLPGSSVAGFFSQKYWSGLPNLLAKEENSLMNLELIEKRRHQAASTVNKALSHKKQEEKKN